MRIAQLAGAWIASAAVLVAATPGGAQDYPTREIRTICPFAPGTGADIVVRYYASKLAEVAGKPVITENRPGAQGLLGTEAIARAKPDGYTISINPVASTMAAAVDAAPCPIALGDWADEILGRPGFPFNGTRTELDLVVVSVADLGFGEQGAALRNIYARALASGLELCPAEAGPALRLNYLDQPPGEFLHLAMRPVARYSGELVDFTLGNGGTDLMLIGGDARPEVILPGAVRLVFVRPRPDAIGRASPTADNSLAKR